MYKVVNNKRYNTETAKRLAAWDNGVLCNDFDYRAETLYRKKNLEYFIHGEGGAATEYAERDGYNTMAGECIIPATEEQARAWAHEHLNGDDYDRIFGEPKEGTAFVTVEISNAAKAKLDAAKSKDGKTQADIIESLLLGL
jgi:hypothetical protein